MAPFKAVHTCATLTLPSGGTVLMFGEDHYSSVVAAANLGETIALLRTKCAFPLDIFIEADATLRQYANSEQPKGEFATHAAAVGLSQGQLVTARHELQIKRKCDQVRMHVTDARDGGVFQLLGHLRSGERLDGSEEPMSLATMRALTNIVAESVEHQVALITKLLTAQHLSKLQRRVAAKALSDLDTIRSNPPVDLTGKITAELLQQRADASMDELVWLTDITTAVRLLSTRRAPIIVLYGGYEHVRNIAMMLHDAT